MNSCAQECTNTSDLNQDVQWHLYEIEYYRESLLKGLKEISFDLEKINMHIQELKELGVAYVS